MDSTIISAPSSTKNKRKKRDPDAYQVKKGNTWHFGYKAHIGVDKDSGLVHTVEATAANVHDVTQVSKLLTGEEEVVYGDSGYLCEVEDEKAVKDFLEDEVQLLKMNGANGVFQAAEGSREVPRLVMRSSVWLFSVSIRTIRKERAAKSVPFGSKPSKII